MPRQQTILPVQYLRGIAALMVVWFHARNQLDGLKVFFPSEFGTSGVDVFFVISGFIMTLTTRSGTVTPSQFMARRIARIVPLYWMVTLLAVGGAVVAPTLFKTLQVRPDTLLKSLLFVPHYSASFPTQLWPVLVPGWTLNYEMFFYAVFALTLFLKPAGRLPVMAGMFLTLVLMGAVFQFTNPIGAFYTRPILLEFVAGIAIAQLWLSGRLATSPAAALALLVAGAALLFERDLLYGLTQGAGAVFVVVGALNLDRLKSRVLQALGDSSYSIYLTHLLALGVARVAWKAVMPQAIGEAQAWVFMSFSLVLCALAGWLCYLWFEKPITARLVSMTQLARTGTRLQTP